jgi:mono/diheme cytochrome c family protein
LQRTRSSPLGRVALRRFWQRRGGTVLVTLCLTGLVAIAGVLAVIYSGVYDVSATSQHTGPVYRALEIGMLKAVQRRARGIEAPPLDDPQLIGRGFLLHRDACIPCHGAPGVAPDAAGKGLLPVPNNLVQTAREWRAAEIYWVTRNGLKMTGMPAWGMRFTDDELWALVAFVKTLPRLTAARYRELQSSAGAAAAEPPAGKSTRPGNPARGVLAIQQYACTACHVIPGLVGSRIYVGPPLTGIARRKYLAGTLPNSPENMVRWIQKPKSISPDTLMPDLSVSDEHARDIAAYLLAAD